MKTRGDETLAFSRRTEHGKIHAPLVRARAQMLIAARLVALGHFREASFMVTHSIESLEHFKRLR